MKDLSNNTFSINSAFDVVNYIDLYTFVNNINKHDSFIEVWNQLKPVLLSRINKD